jgi:hypothetical protein
MPNARVNTAPAANAGAYPRPNRDSEIVEQHLHAAQRTNRMPLGIVRAHCS